jgi:long-subunit fatty acid transport protein
MRTRPAALLAALLAPAVALAGGYAIPNENARDLGLSQATVAAQSGPEATYQNSAALAGQQGLAVSGSLEVLVNGTTWSDPALGRASIQSKANLPPALAVGYGNKLPNGMAYGLGAGFLVPGGGSLIWPDGWQGAQRIQTVEQRVYLLQAGAAIQPIEYVKLGATLLYYRAQEKLTQQINFIDRTAGASLGLAGGAVSFGLAAELRPPVLPLVIGIDYRHKGDIKLTGHAHFDNVPPTFQSTLQDQGVTEHVTAPNELFIGAAYFVIPNLQVMASWNLERWVVYRHDTFFGDKGFTVSVPRNYRNAWVYRVGAEYTKVPFLPALTLRLGGLRSISSQPTGTVSPSLSDGNSWAVSVGAGYQIVKGLRADVGYQFATFDTVTATGPDAFPGSYQTTANLISAGLTWRTDL